MPGRAAGQDLTACAACQHAGRPNRVVLAIAALPCTERVLVGGVTEVPQLHSVQRLGSANIVPAEPHAPEEPPIDVVGEALAAEAAAEPGQGTDDTGLAQEPRGASRDEEHGDPALHRAEVDEITEEAAAALEGDVEPEEHLSEPLVDPADAEAMAAELQMMSKAAELDKD